MVGPEGRQKDACAAQVQASLVALAEKLLAKLRTIERGFGPHRAASLAVSAWDGGSVERVSLITRGMLPFAEKNMFSLVGFKRNLSLLDIFFPGVLTK